MTVLLSSNRWEVYRSSSHRDVRWVPYHCLAACWPLCQMKTFVTERKTGFSANTLLWNKIKPRRSWHSKSHFQGHRAVKCMSNRSVPVKNPLATQEPQEMWVRSLGWEDLPDPLKVATHSSILAWKIPWTEGTVGYSSWSRKESDMTKHTWTHICHMLICIRGQLWIRNRKIKHFISKEWKISFNFHISTMQSWWSKITP